MFVVFVLFKTEIKAAARAAPIKIPASIVKNIHKREHPQGLPLDT